MMDTGIATRLRRAFVDYRVDGEKVKVREVGGWKERTTGNPFDPIGCINHHTAGHPTKENPAPSLGIVTVGRPDLSGPLCNVLFSPFNLTFYTVAAGACNHAGPPDVSPFHGMQFNGDSYSLEVEWDGVHNLPNKHIDVLARGWAAIMRKRDIKAGMLFQHREYAPSRKPDFATNMGATRVPPPGADGFRDIVGEQKKKLENPWKLAKVKDGDVLNAGRLDEMIAWQKDHQPRIHELGGLNLRRNL